MMTEGYVSSKELIEYYGTIDSSDGIGDISQLPINFCLVSDFKSPSDIKDGKVSAKMVKN